MVQQAIECPFLQEKDHERDLSDREGPHADEEPDIGLELEKEIPEETTNECDD